MLKLRLCVSTASISHLHTVTSLSRDKYDNKLWLDSGENPFRRTWNVLADDFRRSRRRAIEAQHDAYRRKGMLTYPMREVLRWELLPFRADFLIIGGGIVGSSIAWWISQRIRNEDMQVVVIERDDTFAECATILSTGGIRQQFNGLENTQMSLFGAEFMRNAGEHLRILDNPPPDLAFTASPYLFLARTDDEVKKMEKSWKMQCEAGAKIKLLNQDELSLRFPFMSFDDVKLGSMGLENEGWIDSWALLTAIREKNLSLGVQYVKANVTGFMYKFMNELQPQNHGFPEEEWWRWRRLDSIMVQPQQSDASPRAIRFMTCILAAGPWSGQIARMAAIGTGPDMLSVPIPIEPRKRSVFLFHCPDGPGLNMPFLVDPSGVWCRREGIGHTYMCGKCPSKEEDNAADHSNLEVDTSQFTNEILPILSQRVPAFSSAKLKNYWAGYLDYNTWDENPIVGEHLIYENMFFCCGFSGHGIQHSIAAGRAVMEKYLDGAYHSINLRKFDMTRMIRNTKLERECVV